MAKINLFEQPSSWRKFSLMNMKKFTNAYFINKLETKQSVPGISKLLSSNRKRRIER